MGPRHGDGALGRQQRSDEGGEPGVLRIDVSRPRGREVSGRRPAGCRAAGLGHDGCGGATQVSGGGARPGHRRGVGLRRSRRGACLRAAAGPIRPKRLDLLGEHLACSRTDSRSSQECCAMTLHGGVLTALAPAGALCRQAPGRSPLLQACRDPGSCPTCRTVLSWGAWLSIAACVS